MFVILQLFLLYVIGYSICSCCDFNCDKDYSILFVFVIVISKSSPLHVSILSPLHVNPNATLGPGYLTVRVLPQRLLCLGASLESKPEEKEVDWRKGRNE